MLFATLIPANLTVGGYVTIAPATLNIDTAQAEQDAERGFRLTRERTLLTEGFEDIRSGRLLTGDELDAWLDRFTRDLPSERPARSAG